jgi:hypothetical protein
MVVVEIAMHVAERTVVSTVLGAAVETFLVGAFVGPASIIMELPMPGVVAFVTVVDAVGKRWRGHRHQGDCGCASKGELHRGAPGLGSRRAGLA